MSARKITIIGLGLIGGSLALALKQAHGDKIEIVGCARRQEVARGARERGAVDRTEAQPEKAVVESDVVFVATPVQAIKEILQQIAPYVPQEGLVTDVGSTKYEIMQWAKECLPPAVDFIGGHPMTGKETSGIDTAEAGLFSGCVYCLTPSPTTRDQSVNVIEGLIRSVGASPLIIEPEKHDKLVAGISHLPLILSSTLVSMLAGSGDWPELSNLAASGYRDVTRLASGNPELHAGICSTNRQAIIEWIDQYVEYLNQCRQLITEDEAALLKFFKDAKGIRDNWLRNEGQRFSRK